MYTAKINRKVTTPVGLKIFVEFYNGLVLDHTEEVIPQDRNGFDFWLKDRLKTLNEGLVLNQTLTDGALVEPPADPVAPVLTQAEIDRNIWLNKYVRWIKVKTTLIDTGIINGANPKATALLNDLKATLQADYIDFI